ncbi:MAG TPA: hypothetical protein VG146_03340, partial [Verrucomicrobiae bacterium]|nr:hypothetical protein [Verrucomicrobiae bacterium]
MKRESEIGGPVAGEGPVGRGAGSAAVEGPGAARFWGPARRNLLLAALAVKAATFLVALSAIALFPSFNLREYHNDIHWPRDRP